MFAAFQRGRARKKCAATAIIRPSAALGPRPAGFAAAGILCAVNFSGMLTEKRSGVLSLFAGRGAENDRHAIRGIATLQAARAAEEGRLNRRFDAVPAREGVLQQGPAGPEMRIHGHGRKPGGHDKLTGALAR
jgi:hypothetical protein